MSIKEILEYNFLNVSNYHLNLLQLLTVVFILLISRLAIKIINRLTTRYFQQKKVDSGRRFAFQQFTKYIIYTISLLIALEAVGIQLSVLWGGAAALLVGIGLGLQQTFNDLISGLILLLEGIVEVDDIVEVNGVVGTVTSIGIRTSKVETRDKISILIPNSKLVGDNATNWSHSSDPSRFQVSVGVGYESDLEKVTSLLLQAADEHPKVLKTPAPRIQFKDYGSSSLDFDLHFFSTEYLGIEFVKSDLRYRITQLFRINGVEIPFPQRDLWLRNPVALLSTAENEVA